VCAERGRRALGGFSSRGGGVGRGVPHGAGAAWGLAPTGGIGSGRERRDASDARVRVCRPEKKKKGWSSPDEQCGFGFI
jgi:hypothetical protein